MRINFHWTPPIGVSIVSGQQHTFIYVLLSIGYVISRLTFFNDYMCFLIITCYTLNKVLILMKHIGGENYDCI